MEWARIKATVMRASTPFGDSVCQSVAGDVTSITNTGKGNYYRSTGTYVGLL